MRQITPSQPLTMASSSSTGEEQLDLEALKKLMVPVHQVEVSPLVERLGYCTQDQAWLTFIFLILSFCKCVIHVLFILSHSVMFLILSHEHIFYFSSFVNRPQLSTTAFSERSKLKYQCLYILWFSFSVVHSLLYDTFSISHHVHSSIDEHMPYFSFCHSSIFSFVHSFLFSSKDDVFLIFTFSAVCIHSLLQAIPTYFHR